MNTNSLPYMFQKLVSIVLMLVIFTTLMPFNVAKAVASQDVGLSATTCQCVVYVKNTFRLSGSAGNARDMGPFLKARGFVQVSSPIEGDIIIMKKPFGHGIGDAGHVAIIKTVARTPKTLTIKIRGANQGLSGGTKSPYWTENNCNNVNFWSGISYRANLGNAYVEYWRKK